MFSSPRPARSSPCSHCPRRTNRRALSSSPPKSSPLRTGPLAIVGGCGHVGLPLGLAFARKGYQVDLLDTVAERVALVNGGRCRSTRTTPTRCSPSRLPAGLHQGDHRSPPSWKTPPPIIVTIGTPVDEYLDPVGRRVRPLAARPAGAGAARPAAGPAQHRLPRHDRPAGPPAGTDGPRRRGPGLLPRAHRAGQIAGRAGAVAAAGRPAPRRGPPSGPPALFRLICPKVHLPATRSRRSWPSCSATPGATSTSPSPTSST